MSRALGIDLGAHTIKIAEIEISSRMRQVVGLYEIERQAGKPEGELLREFLKSSQVKADRVALGIASSSIFVKPFEFPFSDKKRVQAAVHSALEDSLPFDLGNFILDVRPAGKNGKLFKFTCGLAPKSDVDRVNAICETAGIQPTAFFYEAEALGQLALTQNLPSMRPGECVAFVDVGDSVTRLAIVQGLMPDPFDNKAKQPPIPGTIEETRTLAHGVKDVLAWVSESQKIPLQDSRNWLLHRAQIKIDAVDETQVQLKLALRPLVVELYQSFQALKGRTGSYPIGIYITGAVSELPGLREFIADELRLPVFSWPIFTGFGIDQIPLSPEKSRNFALALALTHKFVLKKNLSGWLNFKRSTHASRKILTTFFLNLGNPQKWALARALGLVFGVIIGYGIIGSYLAHLERAQIQSQIEDELRQLDPELGRTSGRLAQDLPRLSEYIEKADAQFKEESSQMQKQSSARPRIVMLQDLSLALADGQKLNSFLVASSADAFEAVVTGAQGSIDPVAFKSQIEPPLQAKGYQIKSVESLPQGVKLKATIGQTEASSKARPVQKEGAQE